MPDGGSVPAVSPDDRRTNSVSDVAGGGVFEATTMRGDGAIGGSEDAADWPANATKSGAAMCDGRAGKVSIDAAGNVPTSSAGPRRAR